jgi:hypothetical protein
MAKPYRYYPRELFFHPGDRLPRSRCPKCGYTHQGQNELCDVCVAQVKVTRREMDEQAEWRPRAAERRSRWGRGGVLGTT